MRFQPWASSNIGDLSAIAISDPPNGKRKPLCNSARSNPVAARHSASIGAG